MYSKVMKLGENRVYFAHTANHALNPREIPITNTSSPKRRCLSDLFISIGSP